VLGITRTERRWQWAAYGKHPSAKDYLRLGQYFPMGRSFSDWVEAGYQGLGNRSNPVAHFYSWRFWTKEARRENVVCGLVKDSADSLGRPYPLLLIGSGPLKGWDACWDLVPLALESVWSQMEYLSTMPLNDVKRLENVIESIRPPVADWAILERRRADLSGLEPAILADLEAKAASLFEKAECFAPIEQQPAIDHFALIARCHSAVKARTESVPSAVFMGGTIDTSCVALYKRPLLSSDFVHLWSLGRGVHA
jgi:type VI secretion system protein VasJ